MMNIFVRILCIIGIVAGAQYFFFHKEKNAGFLLFPSSVTIGETVFSVAVADTPVARERGLSGQPSLAPTTGMLFIFEVPSRPSFWMKEMAFPIDIIWINDDWQIIAITEQVTPDTYPKTFSSPLPVRSVLEIPSGTVATHAIEIGQSVTFKK